MQLILFFFIRRLSNETLISRSVHPLIHPRIYQIHMWKHSNIEQSVSLVFFRVFCCYCCVCVAYLTKNSFMLFVLFFCNRKSIGKRAKAIQWRFGPQSWAGTTISSNPRAYSGMLNITWTYSICDYFNSKCRGLTQKFRLLHTKNAVVAPLSVARERNWRRPIADDLSYCFITDVITLSIAAIRIGRVWL